MAQVSMGAGGRDGGSSTIDGKLSLFPLPAFTPEDLRLIQVLLELFGG